jgi:osmotically inducible lipoprotein OsmB
MVTVRALTHRRQSGRGEQWLFAREYHFRCRVSLLLLDWRILMNFTQRNSVLSAVLLVAAVTLGGCAGMTYQEKGTATGAVIGGVAGNVVGGGILGTAAGAAVGGVIGREVTKPNR